MTDVWYIVHHIELLKLLLHIYLLDWNNLETCSSDRLQYTRTAPTPTRAVSGEEISHEAQTARSKWQDAT